MISNPLLPLESDTPPDDAVEIVLPWPVGCTGNHYKGMNRRTGRVFVTARATAYRMHVRAIAWQHPQRDRFPLVGTLALHVLYRPPDNRARDEDNARKVWQDALTLAGVWEDDRQVKGRSVFEWGEPTQGGAIVVRIWPAAAPPAEKKRRVQLTPAQRKRRRQNGF